MKCCLLCFALLATLAGLAQKPLHADVLVVGGGTGGTAAGIQSARLGARTLVVASGPWLGGMISAAGVSAVDGNHRLPSGLWAEFRSRIYQVYGGAQAVETGWVSNTLFEPHVADSIFKAIAAAEKQLSVLYHCQFHSLTKEGDRINTVRFTNRKTGKQVVVQAKVVIDATELGDVFKAAGAAYDLGMESGSQTGENVGVTETNNIVQDLTYVAILKDFGAGADKTIKKPAGYNPAEFDAACTDYYLDKTRKAPSVNGRKMLDYGRLPRNKYMINWPIYGNDTYLNIVELNEAQREKELEKAKQTTLRFVYFIQQQLGFKNLGLADDEFPTADRLALMPYHRESRRVRGLVRFNMRHIAEPFSYGDPLYRTGISVGDYPIDHHHKKNDAAPQHLEFYPIPSFNVPLGALIPQRTGNLIVAEKGISVSNVVNGTTRLQPCVLLTGQAAGVLAGLSARQMVSPAKVPVRQVQLELLRAKAYLMPYIDVQPDHPQFEAIQKIGATGILRGTGVPHKWANQTWFYPDSLVLASEFAAGWKEFSGLTPQLEGKHLTLDQAMKVIAAYRSKDAGTVAAPASYPDLVQQAAALLHSGKTALANADQPLTRSMLALLLDKTLQPFEKIPVDHQGRFMKTN